MLEKCRGTFSSTVKNTGTIRWHYRSLKLWPLCTALVIALAGNTGEVAMARGGREGVLVWQEWLHNMIITRLVSSEANIV